MNCGKMILCGLMIVFTAISIGCSGNAVKGNLYVDCS